MSGWSKQATCTNVCAGLTERDLEPLWGYISTGQFLECERRGGILRLSMPDPFVKWHCGSGSGTHAGRTGGAERTVGGVWETKVENWVQ